MTASRRPRSCSTVVARSARRLASTLLLCVLGATTGCASGEGTTVPPADSPRDAGGRRDVGARDVVAPPDDGAEDGGADTTAEPDVDPCAESCELATLRCDGQGIPERCVALAGTCNQWRIQTACATGLVCEAGRCVPVPEACVDNDRDGFGPGCPQGPDCDDSRSDVHPGADERCDGVDNDCNGRADEAWATLGEPCGQTSTCGVPGAFVCAPDGESVVCTADTGTERTELCGNELDDDCDGQTDEGFDLVATSCSSGIGVCATTGTWSCTADRTSITCSARPDVPRDRERCGDGLDNDCDGQTDEDCEGFGDACEAGIGACRRSGIVVQAADGALVCNAVPLTEGIEACNNGLDDDCDGQVDENCAGVGVACTVGTGGCRREGTTWRAPNGSIECDAIAGEPALVESCGDRVDDDCDGQVDEGCDGLGLPCTAGIGVCRRSGTTVRGPDDRPVCDAVAGTAGTEICGNGLDDDCDTFTDEPRVANGTCLDDCFEEGAGNDRSLDAVSVEGTAGRTIEATSCPTDRDWYSLGNLAAGTTVQARGTWTPVDAPLRCEVHIRASTYSFRVSCLPDASGRSVTWIVPPADQGIEHYIYFFQTSSGTEGLPYSFQWSLR